MVKIGIVSSHGLVGQFVTSQIKHLKENKHLQLNYFSRNEVSTYNCYSLDDLAAMDIIVSLAPSEYCLDIHPQLRNIGWQGYWLDASSAVRYQKTTCLALPPLNAQTIQQALCNGIKDFSGPNCTTSLLALALAPLLNCKAIDSIQVATYQSLSGAGLHAIRSFQQDANNHAIDTSSPKEYMHHFFESDYQSIGHISPWIDTAWQDGMTREEHKMQAEICKLTDQDIFLNAVCVRVPTLCTHAQTAFVTLKQNTELGKLITSLQSKFTKIVPNTQQDTSSELVPSAVFDSHQVHIGRIRMIAENQFSCHIIGDQLQWGASLPIVTTLEILLDHIKQTTA